MEERGFFGLVSKGLVSFGSTEVTIPSLSTLCGLRLLRFFVFVSVEAALDSVDGAKAGAFIPTTGILLNSTLPSSEGLSPTGLTFLTRSVRREANSFSREHFGSNG